MHAREAYAALGLAPGASAEEVRAAYRRLALETHPDRGGGAAAFSRVQAAHHALLAGGGGAGGHPGATHARARPPPPLPRVPFAALSALAGLVALAAGARLALAVQQPDERSGRIHGIIEPPVNPWLRVDETDRVYHTASFHARLRGLLGRGSPVVSAGSSSSRE